MTLFGFRYPAVILLACVIIGTTVGRHADFGLTAPVVAVLAAGFLLICGFYRLPRKYFCIPLALFVLLGAGLNAYLAYQYYPANDISRYLNGTDAARFVGSIEEWPVLKRHKTILTCRVDSVMAEGLTFATSGRIHVQIPMETTRFAWGDRVSFAGRLKKPDSGSYPGQFNYARHLLNQGIRGTVFVNEPNTILVQRSQESIVGRPIGALRRSILECFSDHLREVPAALASGFLIGETRHIPDDVYQAFRRTGTMHLLAVSGSNVALVLLSVIFLFRYVTVRPVVRILVLLVVIMVFSNLSYNQPSVVRASLMAALILIAKLFYRRIDLNNIIAAVAAGLIFLDPRNLYDVGFQLSFAVTWSLIIFLPQFNRLFERVKVPVAAKYPLLVVCCSVIATAISAPITGYYFGEVSLIAVVSNLLVVPLVSVAVVGSIILLAVHVILPAVAVLPGAALDRLLGFIHTLVIWFGGWEFAQARVAGLSAFQAYAMLIGSVFLFLAIGLRLMRALLVIFVLGIGGMILVKFATSSEERTPQVKIFNRENGYTVIIDAGPCAIAYRQVEDSPYDEFAHDLLPYLTRRRSSLPEYFLFFEPPYRTEQHLSEASELFPDMNLCPIVDPFSGRAPQVWRIADQSDTSSEGGHPVISTGPGWASVHFENIGGIVCVESSAALDSVPSGEIDDARYVIVALEDTGDLAPLSEAPYASRLIVLESHPDDAATARALFSGTERVPDSAPKIVEKSTSLTIPLGTGWTIDSTPTSL